MQVYFAHLLFFAVIFVSLDFPVVSKKDSGGGGMMVVMMGGGKSEGGGKKSSGGKSKMQYGGELTLVYSSLSLLLMKPFIFITLFINR